MDPFISAIVPTFNRLGYVRRAVESALAQTVPASEVIVIDDGSTDGTADALAREYGERIRIVRQENRGVSPARHRGVLEAHGDWIAFLDSDDVWEPDHNEKLLQGLAGTRREPAWIFGDMRLISEGVAAKQTHFQMRGFSIPESPHVLANSLTALFPLSCLLEASLIRRTGLLETDCFADNLRSGDDSMAVCRMALRYEFAAIRDVVGQYYRERALAATSASWDGFFSPDRFRWQVIAYEMLIQSGREGPWRDQYGFKMRSLCRSLVAHQQKVPYGLPFRQLRFGRLSGKALAFCAAAAFGEPGIRLWHRLSSHAGEKLSADPEEAIEAWIERG